MKKTFAKTAAACGLCLTILASGLSASAAYNVGVRNRMAGAMPGQQATMFGGQHIRDACIALDGGKVNGKIVVTM